MTNTPSPDEDRELKLDIRMSLEALAANEATVDETFNDITAVVLADRAKLEEALRDLAEAARNACDARLHTPLIEALAEADYLALNRSTDRAT